MRHHPANFLWSTGCRVNSLAFLLGIVVVFLSGVAPAAEPAETSDGFILWMGINDAQAKIINGVEPADPEKWRSIFVSERDGGWCTAFAVGPRTLMTAAHCIPENRKITIKRPNKESLVVDCKIPDTYKVDDSADYALCGATEDISKGPFETLNRDSGKLKYEADIVLSGFGCTQYDKQSAKDFLIGKVKFYGPGGGNYGLVQGSAAVCFGDSGGPAFVMSKDDEANRILVGVNSMTLGDGATSVLSLVPSNIENFFQLQADNGWVICGITPGAKKCRHE